VHKDAGGQTEDDRRGLVSHVIAFKSESCLLPGRSDHTAISSPARSQQSVSLCVLAGGGPRQPACRAQRSCHPGRDKGTWDGATNVTIDLLGVSSFAYGVCSCPFAFYPHSLRAPRPDSHHARTFARPHRSGDALHTLFALRSRPLRARTRELGDHRSCAQCRQPSALVGRSRSPFPLIQSQYWHDRVQEVLQHLHSS
jgi:hypothetical protein